MAVAATVRLVPASTPVDALAKSTSASPQSSRSRRSRRLSSTCPVARARHGIGVEPCHTRPAWMDDAGRCADDADTGGATAADAAGDSATAGVFRQAPSSRARTTATRTVWRTYDRSWLVSKQHRDDIAQSALADRHQDPSASRPLCERRKPLDRRRRQPRRSPASQAPATSAQSTSPGSAAKTGRRYDGCAKSHPGVPRCP